MRRLRVGIHGAAGYTGGELIRLLLRHPGVELTQVASATFPGQPISKAHPHLRGLSELAFSERIAPEKLDCLFMAGAHGEAMTRVPDLLARAKNLRLIDLSGDFRLKDPDHYPHWYSRAHAAPELLKGFVYGLPELDHAAVARAKRIANPGCFATAVALALGPLAKAGVKGAARVTAMTGSSGSGAAATPLTHHPTRDGNLKAYKPLSHQHVPEVEQLLTKLAGGPSLSVAMVPVSAPFVRGIYAVCHVELPKGWDQRALTATYQAAYGKCFFVRLLDKSPDLNAVVGSNFCDLQAFAKDGQAVVIAALDNLVKGAAGQAIQNMNLMFGLDEKTGLDFPGIYP